jgi:hypothetical protein
MLKKVRSFSVLLVAVILIGLLPTYASAVEQDTWSNANSYMVNELREAQTRGLIPDCIIGTDFTQAITRAEFATVIVLMCEAYTGVSTEPFNGNPFTDTDDPVIFKAYSLGIMQGFDDGEGGTFFSPDAILDRETMVLMFFRAIQLIAPLADYHVAEAPYIPDWESISDYAQESVKYMYSQKIICGGSGGVFMPRPVDAQAESDYGIATREQCVAVASRIYKILPEIQSTRYSIEDKAIEVASYIKDEPQNGIEISRDDLYDILRPYSKKVRWANNLHALSFTGDYQKIEGGDWEQGYDSAFMYNAFSSSGLSQYKYDEEQRLWGVAAGNSRFALSAFDADLLMLSTFEWNSENDTGTSYSAAMSSFNMFSPSSLTDYMPSRIAWVYRLYEDEIINGELCKVFSVTQTENIIQEDTPPGTAGPPVHEVEKTEYFYISTVSGLCVVKKNYDTVHDTTYQSIQIVFTTSPSLIDASKIEPPTDIAFTPYQP